MGQSTRRKDLDRIRIAACFSTFCYHAIQVFDLNPYYHVKSNTLSPVLDVAARLLHAVRMPLFFMIAGMAGFLALQRHSDRDLVRQRARRLLPPFFIGIILFTPVVKYLELLDGRSIDWRGIIQLDASPIGTGKKKEGSRSRRIHLTQPGAEAILIAEVVTGDAGR